MQLKNILLFLYALSAIVFFEDSNLTIIPKIFAGLIILEYLRGIFANEYQVKFTAALYCLMYLTIWAALSYSIFQYDLDVNSVINIALIFILSIAVYNVVDNEKSYKTILVALVLGLVYNYIINIVHPELDEFDNVARFNGTLGNANFFAFMINLLIVILINEYHSYSKFIKLMIMFFILASSYQVIMSGSKMGMALYLINIAFFLFYIKPLRSKVLLTVFTILVIGIFSFLVLKIINEDLVTSQRLEYITAFFSGKSSADDSDLLRYNLAVKGMELWQQQPVFGWGYGSFLYIGGFSLYTHNNIVELLCNTGIIGFLLFHYSLLKLVLVSYKTGTKRKQNVQLAIYFIFIIVISSFGTVILSEKLYWLLYFVILANINRQLKAPFNTVATPELQTEYL